MRLRPAAIAAAVVTPRTALAPWLEFGCWLALATSAFALTFTFATETGTYAWGPASWPRGVVVLMVAFAGTQFALRRRASRHAEAEPPSGAVRGLAWRRALKVTVVFMLPLAYAALLPYTGFYLTTPFFLAAYLALLGERRPVALVGVPILIFALINVVFTQLFYVALPTGNLPGFYDVSNWFVVLIR